MITIPKNSVATPVGKASIPPEYLLMAQAVQNSLGPKVEKPDGKR